MRVNDEINKLLQKDMDRKDFIKHVGIGFAAIAGVSAALKTLTSLNNHGQVAATGYGSSAYGGNPASARQAAASAPTRAKIQG